MLNAEVRINNALLKMKKQEPTRFSKIVAEIRYWITKWIA